MTRLTTKMLLGHIGDCLEDIMRDGSLDENTQSYLPGAAKSIYEVAEFSKVDVNLLDLIVKEIDKQANRSSPRRSSESSDGEDPRQEILKKVLGQIHDCLYDDIMGGDDVDNHMLSYLAGATKDVGEGAMWSGSTVCIRALVEKHYKRKSEV
eukprot:GHVN01055223.1.p1 GENE.GHVN01055223.1~~GHVN01055223.1.p1  ORF type:complete len:152 (-),score=10.29 GHVN01055223.1:90-545(-)